MLHSLVIRAGKMSRAEDAVTHTRRATADSDEGVPLGGLSKLASNVADLMTSLERPRLQRPSASMDSLAAVLSRNTTSQLLTPASTNAKTSPESAGTSPQAVAGS